MVHLKKKFPYLVVIGNNGSRFSMKSHRFLIFDLLDQVNSKTQSIHPIFIDLLIAIVSSIGIEAMTFEAKTTWPSRIGLSRFFEP